MEAVLFGIIGILIGILIKEIVDGFNEIDRLKTFEEKIYVATDSGLVEVKDFSVLYLLEQFSPQVIDPFLSLNGCFIDG